MSDKSNKFGYVGADIPAQSFGNNKGVFNPAEINELVADNKWTSFGQLELIQTQTASAVSALEFTDIKEDIYNVHFMTASNLQVQTDADDLFIRFYENGVLESGSVYQEGLVDGKADGSFSEGRGNARDNLRLVFGLGTAGNELGHSKMYFYNLGDSSKHSIETFHFVQLQTSSIFEMAFGTSVLPQNSVVDRIRIYPETNTFSGTFSLYGIKEYS